MRALTLVVLSVSLSVGANAKELKVYQSGDVLRMDSVPCSGNKLLADDNLNRCKEYLIQSDRVIFHVRPKHGTAGSLPVGERTLFRVSGNNLLFRPEQQVGKEKEFILRSITPSSESTADATPVHLNHLQ